MTDNAPVLEVRDLKKHFPIKKGLLRRTVGHVYAVDGITFTINQGEVANFMREFRMSGQLVVQFPDANFADWKLSLSGSSAVSDAFQQCAGRL